ncbi:MAG TPA: tRNA pseudouridine(55) synthase TruB [Pyrinomonadaceae bacterium]|nr:tRNA pseudouridine(55) synthase TruB [Pyrinomonadaceae bacterium]
MDGILIIDKPVGITSHDVVARCRRILKTKRIGHTGTLDPFATGVMVILVGKATRLAQFLDKDAKEYEAIVRFGFETDTGDRTGELRITNYELREVSTEEIEEVLKDFRGEILQTPPMFSAKKVEGKKLYELARKGIEIERKPVRITIYELRITHYDSAKKTNDAGLETWDLGLKVACSAGTYIRVLAEDIGKKIGVGAHLAELRRTKAGKFGIEKSVTLEKLEEIAAAENGLAEILISTNEAVSHLAEVKLSSEEVAKIKNGVKLKRVSDELKDGEFLRLTESENLLAIGFYNEAEKTVQPKLVLV